MAGYELMHHGILGMRWGVRRTPAQLGRISTSKKNADEKENNKSKSSKTKNKSKDDTPQKKSIKDMTDEEIQTKINRLRLEQQLAELTPKQIDRGQKFVAALGNITKEVAIDMGKQVGKYAAAKALNKVLGEEVIYANNKKK